MSTITVDVTELETILRNAASVSLPWVTLIEADYNLNEPTPPPVTINTIPTVMLEPAFVPSTSYRWRYKDTRQVVLDYVLQRDTNWQTGRVKIFHDIPVDTITSLNEPIPPPLPSPFTAHHLYFTHTIDQLVGSDCGVTLHALHDPSREGVDEMFGLGFQITNALPSQLPRIGASCVSIIPIL